MGVFSEVDMNQQYDGSPFSEDTALPAFSESEVPAWGEPPENMPPTFADDDRQQAEAEVASAVLAQLNQVQGGEQAVSQDSGKGKEESKGSSDAAEDEAKRQAHEASEAKRKAEWEARQQQKAAAMQGQLDHLAAMSDDDAMMAAMKRVSADTEKLTRRNMKECISEHIQTMCLDDPAFARRVMHPRKSMIHCIWYINRKAREFVEQEMKDNGIKPENGVYGSDVPDDLCYQWAVDYFNDPDAKEDKVEEEKFVPKSYIGRSAASRSKSTPTAKAKKEPPKKVETPKSQQKKAADTGQISLGGFMMPEEKAG